MAGQNVRHGGQLSRRQAHVVDQTRRRSAGAAIGTVDGNEIRRGGLSALDNQLTQFIQPVIVADHGLKSDRLAGDLLSPERLSRPGGSRRCRLQDYDWD